MKLSRKAGSTSNIFQIFVRDSSSGTGAGLTGLTNASGSLTAYYHRDTDTTATAIALVTMTVGSFTSSGFKEIDATNMPGWYQFCPPDAALAAGAKSVALHLKGATNMVPLPIEVDLDSQVDVTHWNGTAVSSPATAGIPDVNVKNVNNVSSSSVTTVNANQGTTQPVNFTGTGASALAKSDMVDIAGAAVSTSSAQIGVNAVNIGGTAQTGRDIGASVLVGDKTGFSLSVTPPTAAQVRAEMDSNSTKLANLDVVLSTRLAASSYSAPPSAASIRSEIDSNSTKLDVAVSTRLASGSYTAPDNTSITSIKAKTDNLPTDPADASDIAALFVTVNSKLDTIDDFVDTEVAAIKAKTDNLPSDPADASDITAAFGTVNTTLATIAGYIDTEVAAIKAKTDNLPASPAATGDIPTVAQIRAEIDANSTKLDVAVSTRLATSGYTVPPTVTQIRTELDTNSTKLANLDAAVSTRSTYAGGDTSGTTTLLSRLSALRAGNLDNLDAAISTRSTYAGGAVASVTAPVTAGTVTDKTGYSLTVTPPTAAQIRSEIDSNSTKLDVAVSTRLASGSYTVPPTAAQNAGGLLDLANGVETDYTVREAMRIMLAAMGGKLSGAGTTTIPIRDVNDTKDRIVATVDSSGNRTAVTLDAS